MFNQASPTSHNHLCLLGYDREVFADVSPVQSYFPVMNRGLGRSLLYSLVLAGLTERWTPQKSQGLLNQPCVYQVSNLISLS